MLYFASPCCSTLARGTIWRMLLDSRLRVCRFNRELSPHERSGGAKNPTMIKIIESVAFSEVRILDVVCFAVKATGPCAGMTNRCNRFFRHSRESGNPGIKKDQNILVTVHGKVSPITLMISKKRNKKGDLSAFGGLYQASAYPRETGPSPPFAIQLENAIQFSAKFPVNAYTSSV